MNIKYIQKSKQVFPFYKNVLDEGASYILPNKRYVLKSSEGKAV